MTARPGMTPTPPASPGRTRRGGRGRFWVGFALGFALLALASCGGLALALGFNQVTLAELRGDGSSWTPPTLIPTPTAPEPGEAAPALATGRFAAGQTVYNMTSSRVNVRRTPGHQGKPASDVLAQLGPSDAVVIQGETAQADNLIWWRVNYQGTDGWVAEATASGVEILGSGQ